MASASLDTDYLVVGAGAMGLAFADVLFDEQPNARLVIVERRSAPGGHWNDAYSWVRLHQPAAFYGVNSLKLGDGGAQLSSQPELLAYFERVMRRMRSSGRVTFLPLHEYLGDGQVRSIARDTISHYQIHKRVVDASYMNVEVPATHPPAYEVDPAVAFAPLNALAKLQRSWQRFVIIGGGKTGIDAVLFLCDAGVDPVRICWIVPNDMWMWNRARVQPADAGEELLYQAEVAAASASEEALFLELERAGSLLRLDKDVFPGKWRCATVAEREYQTLCQVDNVVRMGRVSRITPTGIIMDGGKIPSDGNTLHIDCTANGLAAREVVPIFAEKLITLQSVLVCQQVFSAAVIAHLESMSVDDQARNAMWKVVPHPEKTSDLAPCLWQSFDNLLNGNRHMPWWLWRSRLNVASHTPLLRYLGSARRVKAVVPRMQAAMQRHGQAVAER